MAPPVPNPSQLRVPAPDPGAVPERPGASAAMDPELYWREHVYQGGARQLTVRAIIAGMLIGAVMCLSNLYVFLKTGWSLGVTITACILAFAVFGTLRSLKMLRGEFTRHAREQRDGLRRVRRGLHDGRRQHGRGARAADAHRHAADRRAG